jgi:hypothetical protein
MIRSLIGGLIAGIVMFFLGFIFWGTPLSELAFAKAGEPQSAAVQLALAQNLTVSGTGTYVIPTPSTPSGTVSYGRGPIATVHFNTGGFAAEDMSMMLPGLIFALVSGVLMALGIGAVARENSFAETARMVVLFSLGMTIWTILAMPVFNHYGWTYWIYLFVSETVALIAGGLIIARWFVPAAAPVAEPAPTTS